MLHRERPSASSDPPPNALQTLTSAPSPQTDNSFVAQLLALQQTNLDAQQAADARALAAQEAETLICATTQQPTPLRPTTPPDNHIDLRRFCTSDGPTYLGPYQEMERFLAWIQAPKIFFDTKKVTATNDKIRIAGTLIKETNLLLVYSNKAKKYLENPWSKFKQTLFNVALTVRWRQGLKEKIHSLKMDPSETFAQYKTQARLSGGLPTEVRANILKFEILETTPFNYGRFSKRIWIFFNALPA
ncbi:hypothetical protein PTTG_01602 [Puccinia triticina 1-1 BBBD Race 1]|uniref:Uncharacterized protein n=1 Tax=Puccinia triticina (isolate 1-1 / race 1 (BBBD)) TaxID=630390 RepID=A0A180GM61_PUCT1|nr:hypothetical protein PTTG_01602 [Puccinia triticina 1-1 BBBD Race 1]